MTLARLNRGINHHRSLLSSSLCRTRRLVPAFGIEILLLLVICLAVGASSLEAYPVNLVISGTITKPAASGSDPLRLAGGTFNISTTVDSAASPPINISNVTFVPSGGTLVANPNPVAFSFQAGGTGPQPQTMNVTAGPPSALTGTGTMSINVNSPPTVSTLTIHSTIQSQAFTVVVGIPANTITTPQIPAFGSVPIQPGSSQTFGSVITYGSTMLLIGGTVSATTTSTLIGSSPTSLSFSYDIGGTLPASQPLTILTTNGAPDINFALQVLTANGVNWLSVDNNHGRTSLTVNVSVNPTGLTAGTYAGSITVSAPEAGNSPITIPISFTVTDSGASGQTLAPAMPLRIGSGVNAGLLSARTFSFPGAVPNLTLGFTAVAAVTTPPGGTWLSVTPGSGSTPGSLSIAVNPAGLSPGSYSGSITLTSAQAPTVVVPVTLTVTASLTASPTSLTFAEQIGGTAPSPQTLSIGAGGAALPFSAAASVTTPPGGSWLSVVPPSTGTTPGSVGIAVNVAGLSPGTYSGSITVSSPGVPSVVVPVTFTVTAALVASPTTMTFAYQTGGSLPASQTLSVTAGGATISFSTAASVTTPAGGTWLSVLAPTTGTTPGSVNIAVNPAGLNPGTYSGSITVTSTQATNSVTVPVTLNVTSTLATVPTALTFAFQIGGTVPTSQTLNVSASGSATVGFTAAASVSSGANWLSVSPGSGNTTANLTVSVNPAGLTVGSYQGSITLTATSSGVTNSPLVVPVTFTVTAQPALTILPSALTFSFQVGSAVPPAQSLSVGSTSTALSFTAAPGSGAWLNVSPGSGTTPGNISVSVNPAGLAPNVYNGAVLITSAGAANSPLSVPVTLTVTAQASFQASPTALTFAYQTGGSTPFIQLISLTGTTPGLNYTATSSAPGWLWLTTAAGSLPASVGVLVQPTGLAPGVYKGGINISVPGTANASQLITVTLTITSAPALSASAGPLIFAYNIGDPQPVSQTIAVSSTGSPLNFSASTSGGNWLSVSPARGATPGSIAVSVNPAGLAAGTYNGLVSISSQAAVNGLQVVAVTLNVSTHAPSITSVSDAASYLSTAFAPGSIISVWGTLLGPTTPVSFQVSSTGTISNVLADTQVFFDGFPATLLMVSDKQINAIVPYEVTGKTTSTMQVQYQGVKSSTWQVNIVPASPSLFTADQSGKGQGAILNQDGSVNSDSNPADQGSIVVLWGTGDGQTDPPGVDGVLAPDVLADLARPLLGVTVQIDNLDADVIYDGAAPGLVAGVLQINVRLPDGVHSGDVPVVVYVGGYPSQPGVTLAIK